MKKTPVDNSSPIQVEPARHADLPALCELLQHLFAQEAEFNPDLAAQRRGLAMILSAPERGTILVARAGEQVLGMVNLLYTVSTALGQEVALLEDMVVRPGQRAHGIGGLLLEGAITTCKLRGCGRITLLTDNDNHRAQAFYRRHGFEASTMVPMRRRL